MKTQSDSAKLSSLRRELRESRERCSAMQRGIEVLKKTASGMANMFHNLSQSSRFSEDERDVFKRCYMEWDSIKNKVG